MILLGMVSLMLVVPILCRLFLQRFPEAQSEFKKASSVDLFRKYFYKIITAFSGFQKISLSMQIIVIIMIIISQILVVLSYYMIALSIGVMLSFGQLGIMRAILFIIINLPVNFGMGVNVKDVTLVTLLTFMGIPLEKAAAISVIGLAKSIIVGMVGGVIELITVLGLKRTVVDTTDEHLIIGN